MKYLVRWKLLLGPEQLKRLSNKPGLLQVGLDYVRGLVNKGKVIGVYRFVQVESRARRTQPSGIAIVEAPSLEEVKQSIEDMPGLTLEGARGLKYFEYEIDPLVELPYSHRKEV